VWWSEPQTKYAVRVAMKDRERVARLVMMSRTDGWVEWKALGAQDVDNGRVEKEEEGMECASTFDSIFTAVTTGIYALL